MLNLLTSAFDFGAIFGNFSEKWYLYLVLFLVIIGLTLTFIFVKFKPRNSLTNTQKIAYVAVLTALCTVTNFLTFYPANYIAVSFTSVICFLAGFMLDAKSGFAVGFIGDLVGAIIFPSGAYNPLIGIASGLIGFIAGIIFDCFKGNNVVKTIIFAVLTLVICTSGLNTFALWLMYGLGKKSFFAYLIARLPWQALMSLANCVICITLAEILPRILPKSKFNLESGNGGKNRAK